jgi:hypothetical protein
VHEFAQYRISVKLSWNLGPDTKYPKKQQAGDPNAVSVDQIAQETPELFEILRACDASLKIMMTQLRSSPGSSHGILTVENAMDQGCALWVQQIMTKT